MMKFYLYTFYFMLLSNFVLGQPTRKEQLDSVYYDKFFYPSVSIIIAPKGFFEINNFSSLETFTQVFENDGKKIENGLRTNIFSNKTQINYGIAKNNRLNIGLDLRLDIFDMNILSKTSPFKVFEKENKYIHISKFGQPSLRVKYLPFKNKRNVLIQHSINIPDTSNYIPTVSNQIVLVNELTPRLYLFSQVSPIIQTAKGESKTTVSLPVTELVTYLLKPNLQVFALGTYFRTMYNISKNGVKPFQEGTYIGAGIQYQPSLRIGFNYFHTKVLTGKNIGNNNSSNFGIRLII